MTEEMIRLATLYAEAGFTILKNTGKKCFVKRWSKTPYRFPEEIEEYLENWHDNFGVLVGNNHLIIDVDPRNFAEDDKPHTRLFKEAGIKITDYAAVVQTGGAQPGLHLYLKLPKGHKIRKDQKKYQGVEFKTNGQVLGAGGTHPETKKIYKFLDIGLDIGAIKEAPKALLDIIAGPAPKEKKTKDVESVQDTNPQIIERYIDILNTCKPAVEGENGDGTTFAVACKGRDLGLSVDKTFQLMAQYYNPRCIPPWALPELKTKVKNAHSYAKGSKGNDLPEADFEVIEVKKTNCFWEGFKKKPWDKTDTGTVKGTVNNITNYFLEPGPLNNCIKHDDHVHKIKIVKRMPYWSSSDILEKYGNIFTKHEVERLRSWFSREKRFNPQVKTIGEAIRPLSMGKRMHPLKDYLTGLKWDKKARVETWLIDCAGAIDTDLTREVSKVTLLQAVNRIYEPGCQADLVLVLEGAQGIGKSSVVRILGGEYYADILIDPRNKDTVVAMQGQWIIEQSEMVFTRKGEAEAIKRFLTLIHDDIRLPYAEESEKIKRQCVFIGTVNKDATGEYLNDTTGNRRFWPIEISQVKFKKLTAMRDQLFAEAYERLLNGEKPYIDDPEMLHLGRIEQAKRQSTDAYQEIIGDWIAASKPSFVTTKEVWVYALKGQEAVLNGGHQRRIANCLKNLCYELKSTRVEGKVKRGYYNKRFEVKK